MSHLSDAVNAGESTQSHTHTYAHTTLKHWVRSLLIVGLCSGNDGIRISSLILTPAAIGSAGNLAPHPNSVSSNPTKQTDLQMLTRQGTGRQHGPGVLAKIHPSRKPCEGVRARELHGLSFVPELQPLTHNTLRFLRATQSCFLKPSKWSKHLCFNITQNEHYSPLSILSFQQ